MYQFISCVTLLAVHLDVCSRLAAEKDLKPINKFHLSTSKMAATLLEFKSKCTKCSSLTYNFELHYKIGGNL